MKVNEEAYLAHYGILRRSGRYPWGSGQDEYSSNSNFLADIESMKRQGLDEATIAKGVGLKNSTELRSIKAAVKREQKAANIAQAQKLRDKGYSYQAIADRMHLENESSARALLKPGEKAKNELVGTIAKQVRSEVDNKHYVDIGAGTEHHVGVTRTKFDQAVDELKAEGYKVYYPKVTQLGTNKETSLKVLTRPGTEWKDVSKNIENIQLISGASKDHGRTFSGTEKPLSVDLNRIGIKYAEQGGKEADGVIYVRKGVPDLSLGGSHYAQVRIAVNGTHYLKGMAIYSDDLPKGVDLEFNTNKSNTGNKLDAMKKQKRLMAEGDDPKKPDKFTGPIDHENPFGATVDQIGTPIAGKPGRKKLTSAMNLVNEEGDWDKWSKSLSSQMLSKQPPTLAQQQLSVTRQRKIEELNSILKSSNPEVKKKLLASYADDVDASAVHLKAAHLPRQSSRVILPVSSLKPNEVYAPGYKDGEPVVLIRYPHGGKFEIPELTVNNRHPGAKKLIGDGRDAIGIHSSVAARLSGADFDGDTVLVIPNSQRKIKTAPALKGLADFDPQAAYPHYEGMKTITPRHKQTEMGKISNLITDMTIGGAHDDELERAVRHSMVVIDAEKHKLDWTRSARDNGITQLKNKYQRDANGRPKGGAATLISNSGSSSTIRIPKRRDARVGEGGPIDKTTGKRVYANTGESYVKNGKVIQKTQEEARLAVTDNAHALSSGTKIEKIYADHSNELKALANKARYEMVHTKSIPYSSDANKLYAQQVSELQSALRLAERNAPLERQAQILANHAFKQKLAANPEMDKAEQKKIKGQVLKTARNRVGAGKERIVITDQQWHAIQAGAITKQMLNDILTHANLDRVKELAIPRTKTVMPSAKVAQAKAMLANGYDRGDIAERLGISLSTLNDALDPKEG